ncbi:MAG: preprotein translocase subunit YajC [Deltaproteobacteria bacterium]|jgi:preprotein translocase subunit YajC|nr:preprotein translocase subunit YajC [Deltaproteobacteria bacterium]
MFSLLLSTAAQAWAQSAAGAGGAQQQQGGGAQLFIIMGGFILIFYFLLIRPQKKQQKERQNMLDNIKKGDRIQTNGGLLGTVTGIDASELTVLIAPEVRVKMARAAVAGVLKRSPDSSSKSDSGDSSDKTGGKAD